MLQFLQPAGTLFIGLALLVYGLIQAVTHAPPTTAFQAAVQAVPDAFAVLIFALGIAAIIAGIILLVSGIKGVRSRAHDINHTYGRPRPRNSPRSSPQNFPRNHPRKDPYEEYGVEDWDDHPAYR